MAANLNSTPAGPTQPWARFDDFPAGRALRFPAPHRVLTASRPDEVVAVLAEVDRATRAGCWAYGYVGYEAAAGLDDRLVTHPPAATGPPLVWFGLSGEPEPAPVLAPRPTTEDGAGSARWSPGWLPSAHRAGVERVRAHIAAGETYQCNLTVRMRGQLAGDPAGLYADLAPRQQGAYSAYLDLGRYAVASASPELFFEWRGDELTTRPMKGTARRGRHLNEDRAQAQYLLGSAKERAENIMIVDLMRNDLARLATTGGVTVRSLCRLERYPTVLQLTSEVTGRLRPEVDLVEVFRALFPCGSITGAPKARTMELIRELEDEPRGVYCGAIGWVGPPGAPSRARFSVAIRTAVADRADGTAVYGTGGGITWSSDAAAEHAELLVKTAVLNRRPEDFHLLETMGHTPGAGIRHLERHLRRLADSAAYFGWPLDLAAVRAALPEVGADPEVGLVRLRLWPSGAVRVETAPAPAPLGRPVRLALDPEPVDSGTFWPYHKTSRREPYTARARRHPEADDVVLRNERGELTETTIANLAVRLAGRWWTPPLSAGCLPGVERGRLVELGELAERTLYPADLVRADGLAVLNSLRGWRPAVLADASSVPAPAPAAR
ncbi:MAG TPA: aminodeoxychorismate synthase component I [Pseudonocardia sp.]|jgi:para-aminobenzoate synthetase/4-amino-4-deoxychorismate lyase|nr:aminodeoxychorismate synthase component I [Pseudonocardia sp.]